MGSAERPQGIRESIQGKKNKGGETIRIRSRKGFRKVPLVDGSKEFPQPNGPVDTESLIEYMHQTPRRIGIGRKRGKIF